MKTTRIGILFTFLAFVLPATGCTHGARLSTPNGFATLDDGNGYSYRATNAKGVVLATRTEPNDVKANTEFWADTLDAKLRDKGYRPDGTEHRNVKTSKGLSGTQLRYLTSKDGREHRYWVTVFATNKKVFVVEAAGDKDRFDKSLPAVEGAITSLDASE